MWAGVITLERQPFMNWELYLNHLVIQWNCCIYSVNLLTVSICSVVWGVWLRGPEGHPAPFVVSCLHFYIVPLPQLFAKEHAALFLCLLNRCIIQVLTCTNRSLFWVLVCLFLLEENYWFHQLKWFHLLQLDGLYPISDIYLEYFGCLCSIALNLMWSFSWPVQQWAAVLGLTMTEIRGGVCCVRLGHTRTRRDRCSVRSVQDQKDEKSQRLLVLATCLSVEVRALIKDPLQSVQLSGGTRLGNVLTGGEKQLFLLCVLN